MRDLTQLLRATVERHGTRPAFARRGSGKEFLAVTYEELYERVLALGTALIQHCGLAPREHVGLIADNRLEWIIADLAVICAGAADVPRGADATDGDLEYILPHAGARIVFLENSALLSRVLAAHDRYPGVEHWILMSGSAPDHADFHAFDELLDLGRRLRKDGDRTMEERMAGVRPEDLFTLIYTSGTTGAPKGVMLSHDNVMSQVRNLPLALTSTDRMLSILPIWHIFERALEIASIAGGACTYYTNVRNIRDDLRTVRPTVLGSAPRLWENLYNAILQKVSEGRPVQRMLFHAAYRTAQRFYAAVRRLRGTALRLQGGEGWGLRLLRRAGSVVTILVFAIPYFVLDRIVLKKIRAVTGGVMRGSLSGGGALPEHIDRFFNDIGIPVLEGYGLTETSPILSMRTFDHLVIGTAGDVFPGTDLRLVDLKTGEVVFETGSPNVRTIGAPGEIHARGPQVMQGYYRNPEATRRVLDGDGWFNTGDIGLMTANGCLKIIGRSKETIVLSGGENVEPVPVENTLQQSPYIDQCMLIGQDRKYLAALIVPSAAALEEFQCVDLAEAAENAALKQRIGVEIRGLVNAEHGFKSFERVADFVILPVPFRVGEELTAKMSLRRHVITERYASLIEQVYARREVSRRV